MIYDRCIIGGGAAGMFCAMHAAQRGLSVLVIDHAHKPGRKILISGGGRCNFTNRKVSHLNFSSQNPQFCRSALSRYTPDDFIALVEARGIAYEERRHGQLFCLDSAKEIVALLVDGCQDAGVELRWGVSVQQVERSGDQFTLTTSVGPIQAHRIVIATGGLPVPSLGATDFGLRIARQFGHRIVETAPALAPLLLPPEERLQLPGIAVDAVLQSGGPAFQENILFTHGGISGPSVLQVSTYWRPSQPVQVNVLPHHDVEAGLMAARGVKGQLGTYLAQLLPKRLVQARVPETLATKLVSQLSKADMAQVASALQQWELHPSDTDGWLKAEVMRGGVDTTQLSSRTMESTLVPGLHFIGEVVDVTGWLGGFNFQWAWASAYAASQVD